MARLREKERDRERKKDRERQSGPFFGGKKIKQSLR